jgi:hypothetical protein
MFLVGHPIGLHILDLVGVGKYDLVELGRVQDREVQGRGVLRNIRYQVHARLELQADRWNHDGFDYVSGAVNK